MLGSSNPALSDSTFDRDFGRYTGSQVVDRSDVMTINGTVWKAILLIAICICTGSYTWGVMTSGGNAMPWMLGGLFGGLIIALATIFKPNWSPFTAPLYAGAQGLFLGAVSAVYAARTGGAESVRDVAGSIQSNPTDSIVLQAIGCTIGVALSMLILYAFRIIKVTEKLRAGILIAVTGVAAFYLFAIVASMFGMTSFGGVFGSGPIGIGFSLVVVAIAAFSLLLDFDIIERGSRTGAPKYMEWYGAFALMVTLVWLYLEILRLLSKLRSGD